MLINVSLCIELVRSPELETGPHESSLQEQ